MPSSYQFALWKQESLLVRRVHCWAQGEERSMGFFGKRSTRRSIEDPDFGRITEGKAESWEGDGFQLWGGTSIKLMIDAGPEGPSAEQRSFVRSLRGDEGIRVRIEQAVAMHAKANTNRMGALRLSGIYLPQSPLRKTWRVRFDMEGEEHYWYGAEVEGSQRIVPFAED